MRTSAVPVFVAAAFLVTSALVNAADRLPTFPAAVQTRTAAETQSFHGQVSVIDGRTLWFPRDGVQVQLEGIDACELPQWGFDPYTQAPAFKQLTPVPCGAFAKAWLKRTIGGRQVDCRGEGYAHLFIGRCRAGNRDLGLELLSVGWAKVSGGATDLGPYVLAERQARAARNGMWGTYLLDMPEWRGHAVDRTDARRPIADFNLLRNRRSEISPPFVDARRLPTRTDR